MNVLNYINKYKILFIILIVLIVVVINYNPTLINYNTPLIEGYTSCGNLNNTSCKTCINAAITGGSTYCSWNNEKKLCGSSSGNGYSRACAILPCSDNTTCESCITNGCYWDASAGRCGPDLSGNYKNTCPPPPPACETYSDCSACTTNKCFWNKDASTGYKCASFSSQGYRSTCGDPKCDLYSDCTSCINDDCYWNPSPTSGNKKCKLGSGTNYSRSCPTVNCSDNTTCSTCIANGCYWDASASKCGLSTSGSNYKNTCTPPSSCETYKDCSTCTSKDCYWNSKTAKCKSGSGTDYSKTCSDNTCPNFIKLPYEDIFIKSPN